MSLKFLLLSIIFVPTIGSFLLPFLGRISTFLRNWIAFLFVAVSFIFSLIAIPHVWHGNVEPIRLQLAIGFNFVLMPDCLAVFMACVSSFISALIILYSHDYISHYENQNEYYWMVVLFIGSMMGLVFSGNLILLYIFWEITAITSWRLIGYFRGKRDVLKADKAFLVTIFGALAMLVGFISIYQQTGSFDLTVIKESSKMFPIKDIVVLLILMGILSKSATLPFHTWLPDAGVAPSPVTALLHAAVLVKIGVYVFARLFVATFTFNETWNFVVMLIGGASALIAAGAALIDTDLKRIIAFSTVSQIGFIFFGLASGSKIGVAGALLYILMHGLAKAGLFLCAGIVEQNTHVKDITKLGGLIKTMPITAISFLICALSVMGVPPFGGFFSKYLVFMGAVDGKNYAISFIYLIGAFFTILYLFRLFRILFLGEVQIPDKKEGSPLMVGTVVLFALLSLAAGILFYYPSSFVQNTVNQMLGFVK